MSTNNKRKILVDSSSAILLFKGGALPSLLNRYSCIISGSVYNELVKDGYEGADFIADCCSSGLIEVLQVSENDDCIDIAMDSGEREIISLYLTGAGDFIIIDDKKGAFFCRRKGIPYINALLAVKILYMLFLLPHKKFLEIYEWLKNNGRYSRTVIDWADNSTYNDLKFFLKVTHKKLINLI